MKTITKTLTTLLLTLSLLGGMGSVSTTVGVASAAEVATTAAALPSALDEALLALINQARQNPLAVAASMGMNPEKIVKDLPGLEKILREGLPPVAFNANLFAAARAHTKDMFSKGYYSHVSLDGVDYDARIRNSGYPAGATGESLGMLLFANFIKPAEAARLLFEYIYWDELDPARKEKRNILDPAMQQVGISVDTGVLRLGGKLWNVYLATCDFGSVIAAPAPVPDPTPEGELLKLVNQARSNPLAAAASLGIDTATYLEGRPELRAAFEQGLAPLTVNALLSSSAQARVQDMLANNYYGKVSPDGRTYQGQIAASGYRFAAAGESLGLASFTEPPADPLFAAARRTFQDMLRNEFSLADGGELAILDPQMKEIGIGLGKGVFRSGGWQWDVYLAVCDVGVPLPVDPAAWP